MTDKTLRPPTHASDIKTLIDHEVAMRLVTLLNRHGATVQQLDCITYTAKLPGGKTQERPASNHLISFPPGSLRYDGLVLGSSADFCIVFPDGFELNGVEQWGMIGGDKTLIFLPANCDE
jgi:hypothetical protein